MDLLSGSIGGKVFVFRRKPNGAFLAGDTIRRSAAGSSIRRDLQVGSGTSLCATDWFSRGKLDLLIGNGEGTVFLVRNEGTRKDPRYSKVEALKAGGRTIVADGGSAGPFVFDWDGDGLSDLLLGCGSGRVVFYENTGTKEQPELASGVTLLEPAPENTESADHLNPKRSGGNAKVCATDWNGDGRPDLIVGDYTVTRIDGSYKVHGWVWVYLRKADLIKTSVR